MDHHEVTFGKECWCSHFSQACINKHSVLQVISACGVVFAHSYIIAPADLKLANSLNSCPVQLSLLALVVHHSA